MTWASIKRKKEPFECISNSVVLRQNERQITSFFNEERQIVRVSSHDRNKETKMCSLLLFENTASCQLVHVGQFMCNLLLEYYLVCSVGLMNHHDNMRLLFLRYHGTRANSTSSRTKSRFTGQQWSSSHNSNFTQKTSRPHTMNHQLKSWTPKHRQSRARNIQRLELCDVFHQSSFFQLLK